VARLKAPMYILKRRAEGESRRAQTRDRKLRADGVQSHKNRARSYDLSLSIPMSQSESRQA
jgi:hypothetical protein